MREVYFSIIISTLNAEKTLRPCLDSLQCQTFRDFELIVQDGGSSDNTLSIFGEYPDLMPDIESVEDIGVYDAWNKALGRCAGKWVYFLGADNILHDPAVLSDVATYLDDFSEDVSLAYGRIVRVDEQSNRIDERGLPWRKTQRSFFRYLVSLPHAAAFQKLSQLRELGGFPLQYKIKADSYVMLASALKEKPTYVDRAIVLHRMGGISTKISHQTSSIKEAWEILDRCGLPTFWVKYKYAVGVLVSAGGKVIGWKNVEYIMELLRSHTGGRYSK